MVLPILSGISSSELTELGLQEEGQCAGEKGRWVSSGTEAPVRLQNVVMGTSNL